MLCAMLVAQSGCVFDNTCGEGRSSSFVGALTGTLVREGWDTVEAIVDLNESRGGDPERLERTLAIKLGAAEERDPGGVGLQGQLRRGSGADAEPLSPFFGIQSYGAEWIGITTADGWPMTEEFARAARAGELVLVVRELGTTTVGLDGVLMGSAGDWHPYSCN
jgi:hypothetical protein